MGKRHAARHPGVAEMNRVWNIFIASCLIFFTGCCTAKKNDEARSQISAASEWVTIMGRVGVEEDGSISFGYPGVTLSLNAEGGSLIAWLRSTNGDSWIEVRLDGVASKRVQISKEWTPVELFSVPGRQRHRVDLTHFSESWHGLVSVRGFELNDGRFLSPPSLPQRKILVLGDSVTCGEAIDRVEGEAKNHGWWNARESYGMLLAQALDAQVHLVCWGGRGLVRTWDNRTDVPRLMQFYEYAVGDGDSAVKWDHRLYQADLIVSAIGTNDFSPGIPERESYVRAYLELLQVLRKNHKTAQIVVTEGALLGGDQKEALRMYLQEVIQTVRDVRLHYVPSEQYPGDHLDFHPNKAQHAAMADDFLPHLRRIMNW